ncbi:hypothetical protein CN354_01405 [Bacillus cereus]|nr:hypothetical protein CN354_01405 [Bacillus cereus]
MLKKGDKVVIYTCGEADKYKDRIWTCKTDEYINRKGEGIFEQRLVFLEGFSGCLLTKYLRRVEILKTL